MKMVFMGTPDFSVPALRSLMAAGHEILAVYTQPPRPVGRGQKPRPGPVHACATAQGLCVRTPESFEDPSVIKDFVALGAEVVIVVAYGLLLPSAVLSAPRLGCLNIHASLLPRWRGAAPIQRAIEAGDRQTGVAIMQMDQGLDTGPVLLEKPYPITTRTTAKTLHDQLSVLGAEAMIETLILLEEGKARAIPQAIEGMTYARKLKKGEGALDWRRSAVALARQQRALTPWPGVYFLHRGQKIKVLQARVVDQAVGPETESSGTQNPGGAVLDLPTVPLAVACGGGGVLALEQLQRPGGKPVDVADFLNGYPLEKGTILEAGDSAS